MPKKGKKGVDQRVKGNVKSANSQRMAELMGDDRGGVIGFGAVSSGVPNLENGKVEEVRGARQMLRGDSSLQVVMKQLGKRDATTKLKALQEFTMLTQQLPLATTLSVLSWWSLMYNKLSMDNDNRVREASHKSLKAVVEVAKDSLKSHFSSIIGCWMAGMNDPYGPSASSARAAFTIAFPDAEKQLNALHLGFKAIINHVNEMSIKSNPDTFSDPKVVAPDERVQRYERALVMTLTSMRNVFQHMSTDYFFEKRKVWEDLLSDKKFWKLAKHQNPAVRAVVFSVVTAVCHKDTIFIQSHGKLFCSLVLGSLGESESSVVGPLWEATLMIVVRTEIWVDRALLEKTLLPGLWSLLTAGGYGSASIIYPYLLPILNKITEKVFNKDYHVHNTFLENLKSGLQLDRPQTPHNEFEVMIKTFNECLLYLVIKLKLPTPVKTVFIKQAIDMVLDLVTTSLKKGPSLMQSEVVFSHSVKLITKLVDLQQNMQEIRSGLSNFQLYISRIISKVLESEDDVENNFARVGSFLKCFFSRSLWTAMERKSTSEFSERQNLMIHNFRLQSGSENYSTTYEELKVKSDDDAARQFMAPAICSLCALSIEAVSSSVNLNHSQLLLTMVRLYADISLIQAVFSCLESNYLYLIKEYRGEKILKKKLLIICTILTKAARIEKGVVEHTKFTENIVESIILLLQFELVDCTSAALFLSEIMKSSVSGFPLFFVKLIETDKRKLLGQVVTNCTADNDTVPLDLSQADNIFLWKLLNTLFTNPAAQPKVEGVDLVSLMFGTVCQEITKSLQELRENNSDLLRKMFQLVCTAHASLIQDNADDVTFLLGCIYHWCLSKPSDLILLQSAIKSYHNLVNYHPDLPAYIRSLPSLVLEKSTENLHSSLLSAILYFTLHCHLMKDADNLINLYEPMLKNLCKPKDQFLPLSCLESFCDGSLHYPPLFSDLNSTYITTTLPPLLLFCLFPAISLTDPSVLHLINLTESPEKSPEKTSDSDKIQKTISSVLTDFLDECPVHTVVNSILYGRSIEGGASEGASEGTSEGTSKVVSEGVSEGASECTCEGASEKTNKILDRIAQTLLTSLGLSISSLQASTLKKISPLESQVCHILQSTLHGCLEMAINKRQHWIQDLITGIIDRMLVDQPVWLLALQQIFIELGNCYMKMNDLEPFRRIINAVLHSLDCSVIYSSLFSLDRTIYSDLVMDRVSEIGNDPSFLVSCLYLMPEEDQLISAAVQCLSSIAQRQNSSEIALFESLVESSQDQLSYTTLDLVRILVKKHKVPDDVWDFILCSLITLTQMIAEADVSCVINQAVFFSRVLNLCHDISFHCMSPHCRAELAREWEEFFQPALQECLLPLFIQQSASDVTMKRNEDPCLIFQHYSLCRAVSALSFPAAPNRSVTFEDLIEVVVSDFYPQQVAAFLLSKRSLELHNFVQGDSEAIPEQLSASFVYKIPMSVKVLQVIFNKALDKINMDSVFMEDTIDSTSVSKMDGFHLDNTCNDTTAYIFTWILIIEAIQLCDPETRGEMTDWLKELSLFDHFLHGLFKYLNENTGKPNSLSMTLQPSLEQLACIAYAAVAKKLPSMLRQWYLTLDRQTSSVVSRFTTKTVSPALQQAELQGISNSNTSIGNMDVHVYTGASEVAVVYRVDEFSIELFVCLPDSYPLQPPSIREGKKVKVDPSQWRKWMLQLTIFVTNQNGSLLDGLMLWKSNLDKHFSGADDCMICFSVIHSSNYSLPKMVCRTCKKKFHSACLYKWFSSSTKSSCPLCRNIF